jgi:hypothetical protein
MARFEYTSPTGQTRIIEAETEEEAIRQTRGGLPAAAEPPEPAAPSVGVESMYGGGVPTAAPPTDPTATFVHKWAPAAALTGAGIVLTGGAGPIAAGMLPAAAGPVLTTAARLGTQAATGAALETGREAAAGEPLSPLAIGTAAATQAAAELPGKLWAGGKELWRRRPAGIVEAERRAAELAREIPGKVREVIPKFRGTTEVAPAYEAAKAAMKAEPGAAIPMGRTVTAIDKALEEFPAESGSPAFEGLRDAATRLKDMITQKAPDMGQWHMAVDQFKSQADLLWQRVLELPKGPAKQRLKHIYGELQEDLTDAARAAPTRAAAVLKQARDSNVMQLASDKLRELVSEGLPTTAAAMTERTMSTLAKTIRKNADLKRWLGPDGLDAVVGQLEKIRVGVPKPWPKGAQAPAMGEIPIVGEAWRVLRYLGPEMIQETVKAESNPLARLISAGVLHGLRRIGQEAIRPPPRREPEPEDLGGLTPEPTP